MTFNEHNRERDLDILKAFKKYIQLYNCDGKPEKHEFKINGLLTYVPDCTNNYVTKFNDNGGCNLRKENFSLDICNVIDFSTEEGYFQSSVTHEPEVTLMFVLFQYIVQNVDRILVVDMEDLLFKYNGSFK